MKTYVATPADRQRDWYLIDAEGKTLGRLATQIANTLRGKRKPEYTPHCDTGDFVVVVNAEKIHVTGDKRSAKMYRHHSGYPGGLRTRTLEEMLQRRPEEVIRIAVTGNKRSDKLYHRHTGYPGGVRTRTLGEMLERRPEEVIRRAVGGMLPRNRLARQQLGKLKVYAGPDHPHAAQKPKPMEIEA